MGLVIFKAYEFNEKYQGESELVAGKDIYLKIGGVVKIDYVVPEGKIMELPAVYLSGKEKSV